MFLAQQAAAGARGTTRFRNESSKYTLTVTATRQGDVTAVKVGNDERYDIPDAFLNGG